MVVDLTVKYDPDRSVFVADRLMSGGKVDDAETAHSKAHAPLDIKPLIVGASMYHGGTHPPKNTGSNPRLLVNPQYARDSAHSLCRSWLRKLSGENKPFPTKRRPTHRVLRSTPEKKHCGQPRGKIRAARFPSVGRSIAGGAHGDGYESMKSNAHRDLKNILQVGSYQSMTVLISVSLRPS